VPGVPVAAPAAAPISQQQLEALVDLISGAQRVVVVTGAGCSTESNIPDYRGPRGAYTTGRQLLSMQQ
jgi:NAD-dependent SIR2 family protein deacetylase